MMSGSGFPVTRLRHGASACLLLGFLIAPLGLMASPAGVFPVRDHGARGDGAALDTAAIQKAIDACAAAGGGQVVFTPGRYLSGTIQLKSHVTLVIEAGATLVGSSRLDDYQSLQPPAEMPEAKFSPRWHRGLVLATNVEDVAILGPGTIDGAKVFDPQGEERMRGPHAVLMGGCRGVTIRDLTIRDAANYAVMLELCSGVEVVDSTFRGGWDGVHFRGRPGHPCRDVTIANCRFFTGDDAIAGRYWDRTLITGCVVNSSCNGIRLIGPATALRIHDCLFYGPGLEPHRSSNRTNMLAAINLQPGAWDATEGPLDDVLISDVTMRNVTTPFHFTMKPGNTAGTVVVDRASASGVYLSAASVESWAEAPFGRVVFRDVAIEFEGGGDREPSRKPVRSPGVDARPLPAWGLYVRNVKDLVLDGVRLRTAKADGRPVVLAEKVGRLDLSGLQHTAPPEGGEPFVLEAVESVERPR